MRALHTFQSEFEQVLQEKHIVRREIELANLMIQMEKRFDIPLLQDVDWEDQNEEIIRLYRTISDSRLLVENSSKVMVHV